MGLLYDPRMDLRLRLAQLWMDRCLEVVWFFQYPRIVVVFVVILPRIVVVVVVIVGIVVVVDLATFGVAMARLPRCAPRLLPLLLFLTVVVVS